MNSIALTRRLAGALFAACSIIGGATFLHAQTLGAPSNAPSPATAPDPLREAFDSLPEAERRAVQDALVWTGDYKGSIDGVLGRGGVAALSAFAKRTKTTPEAALADARRKQLLAEAQKLKTDVRFALLQDARSGASIALPAAVFTRKTDTPSGARWTNTAGSASVETFREAEVELSALFERLRAAAPGRKVTYSILRPEFLVVTGEDQRGLFYIRAARGDVSGKPLTRGYTLIYARTLQASFDVFSIAISNGFQAFPTAAMPAQASVSVGAAVAPPAPRRVVEATAIALAPTRALTAMTRDCPDMRVGDAPGKMIRRDEATGLALIETQGLRGVFARPSARAPGDGDVFVLFAAQAGPRAGVSLAPGRAMAPAASNGAWRVSAAVQDGVGGAAVFDRSGSWMGVLAQPPQEPRRVAGVIPQAAWRMASADAALAFLAASGVKLEAGMITSVEKSAGEVANANAGALIAISCQR